MKKEFPAVDHCLMKAIRASLFLILIGSSGFSAEPAPFEIGPWKLGMSKSKALGITTHGELTPVSPSAGTAETVKVSNEITYFNQKGTLEISFENGKISDLIFIFAAPGISTQDRAIAYNFSERLADGLRISNRDTFLERINHCLERVCTEPSVTTIALLAGFPNVRYEFRTWQGKSYRVMLRARTTLFYSKEFTPPSTPKTPDNTPPAEEPDERNELSMWSYRAMGSEGKELKLSISSIHALLVRPLDGGRNAAAAMKLTATAVPVADGGNIEFAFNQAIGNDMKKASEEVVRAVLLRNGGLPANFEVQFGFADKWVGKDGPSAAVACAILLESMIHGFEIPAHLAVTGDLNSDSSVQPVGGVADKIRGAMDMGCNVIGIPRANEEDVDDLVVEESLRRFLSAKIFTLNQLGDAIALADPSQMSATQTQAIADLEAIQNELGAQGALLYSPVIQGRLSAVYEALPNCYTAKLLLAASRHSLPTRYSLAGSLVRIDESMAPFADSLAKIKNGIPIGEFQYGRDNPLQEAKNRLNSLRTKSDERLIGVIDSQKQLVDQFQRVINSNTKSTTVHDELTEQLKKAVARANLEWDHIRGDRDIQDQIMRRGISL